MNDRARAVKKKAEPSTQLGLVLRGRQDGRAYPKQPLGGNPTGTLVCVSLTLRPLGFPRKVSAPAYVSIWEKLFLLLEEFTPLTLSSGFGVDASWSGHSCSLPSPGFCQPLWTHE